MICPMALFPTMETCTTSSLRWRCLVALVGCWGQEGELPGCSNADIDFLPAGCFGGITAAEETASSTTTAGSDADAGAGDLA
jgi:hypothetical protein